MLSLLLILIVMAVSLTIVLWAGTYFFQGYIYTEPSQGIFWQAPAAAATLTLGFAIWVFSIAFSSSATSQNLPIDAIHRFSPTEDMLERPAATIWAIKSDLKKPVDNKDGTVTLYKSKRDPLGKFYYQTTSIKPDPWRGQDVIAIEIQKPDESKMRFDLGKSSVREYRQFVSSDGWVIREYSEGPTGLPVKFRFIRLLLNLLFNFGHFVAWFAALWLILRFQWSHALGLAVVAWVIFTLVLLPMILSYAGHIAASRQPARATLVVPMSPFAFSAHVTPCEC